MHESAVPNDEHAEGVPLQVPGAQLHPASRVQLVPSTAELQLVAVPLHAESMADQLHPG
jgi:hypothetical protein